MNRRVCLLIAGVLFGSWAWTCSADDGVETLGQLVGGEVCGEIPEAQYLVDLMADIPREEILKLKRGRVAIRKELRQEPLYWDLNWDGVVNLTDGIVLLGYQALLPHQFQGEPEPKPVPVVFGTIVVPAGKNMPAAVEIRAVYPGGGGEVLVLTTTPKATRNQPIFAASLFPGECRISAPGGYEHDPDGDGQYDTIAVRDMGETVGAVELIMIAPPPPVCSLEGIVTCQGQPVPDATVVAWDANQCTANQSRTVTDDAGHYCFESLPSGGYKVLA